MKDLVEYIARAVVDNPESVVVSELKRGERVVIRLQVAQEDMGKVIGRQGRIAQAIRSLLKVAAMKEGARATLEIE
ncbi:MAG: KH domain-containing protein [Chloroflexi bacterium]|nr:KH domain-containing protein [Chloroflexota bacterium]